jgi:ribulose 1,5-bisphosphate carboxylase large subunit-like protein
MTRPMLAIELMLVPRDEHTNVEGVQRAIDELRREIEVGTFGEYTEKIFRNEQAARSFGQKTARAVELLPTWNDQDLDRGRIPVTLRLGAEDFDDPAFGLQRLLHFLCSDLFERRSVGKWTVEKVDLSALERIRAHYGPRSRDRDHIETVFGLQAGRPLLAFSVKPRARLEREDYLHLLTEAIDGGCDLVEMDTRDFPRSDATYESLVCELYEAAWSRNAQFSANFSGPLHRSLALLSKLAKKAKPWVIKIDGTFDGLSTLQGVRDEFAQNQPIVTTWPALKYALPDRLGSDLLLELFVMSGSDIIYPGGQPPLRQTTLIDASHNLVRAQMRYQRVRELGEKRPLPSIAGGIHAGLLHAYYAMFGPDTAFFVGGGIALARDGIKAGAQACRRALNEAAEFRDKGVWDADAFRSKLAVEVDVYDSSLQFTYFNPASELKQTDFPFWSKG